MLGRLGKSRVKPFLKHALRFGRGRLRLELRFHSRQSSAYHFGDIFPDKETGPNVNSGSVRCELVDTRLGFATFCLSAYDDKRLIEEFADASISQHLQQILSSHRRGYVAYDTKTPRWSLQG